MMNTKQFDGHTPGPWDLIANYSEGEWDNTWEGAVHLFITLGLGIDRETLSVADARLIAAAPDLLAEVKRYQLQDYAIQQAEHMGAQVGDDTWHYAMEVWLRPETHYWEVDDEAALIERYITTNRDAWVKRWGEPTDIRRGEE